MTRVMDQLSALKHFATFAGGTQSQRHIKPLHEYVATRLVLEGGLHPDEITPHPPLRAEMAGGAPQVVYDRSVATAAEATLIGGLKTKDVDIVVTKQGIGPVLAVSCKGMTGAVRNLTNRLEETIGECTNIHIRYPALVFGYLFLMRANRAETAPRPTDVAVDADGAPLEGVVRFGYALGAMTGRLGIRDDVSRYEAVALALVDMRVGSIGAVVPDFPPADSPINLQHFFATLYRRYDERYVVSAPQLASRTRRLEWSADSPAWSEAMASDYVLRNVA